MTESPVVTIAGKRYANAAAYIQSVLGSLRSHVHTRGSEPIPVTMRSTDGLDPDEVEALR